MIQSESLLLVVTIQLAARIVSQEAMILHFATIQSKVKVCGYYSEMIPITVLSLQQQFDNIEHNTIRSPVIFEEISILDFLFQNSVFSQIYCFQLCCCLFVCFDVFSVTHFLISCLFFKKKAASVISQQLLWVSSIFLSCFTIASLCPFQY